MSRLILIAGLFCALHAAAPAVRSESPTTQPAVAEAAPPATSAAGERILSTQREQMSYSLGMTIGLKIKQSMIPYVDVDPELVTSGFRDSVVGGRILMTEQEIAAAFLKLRKQLIAGQRAVTQNNKKKSEAFLAENAKRPGFKVTNSGLQYRVVHAGTGKPARVKDFAVVHYTGTLTDSTVFDSSHQRRKPFTFDVGSKQIIAGWNEVLQLMNEGAKWQVVIPPQLAYKAAGNASIPPNAVLIFDIELLEIERAENAKP